MPERTKPPSRLWDLVFLCIITFLAWKLYRGRAVPGSRIAWCVWGIIIAFLGLLGSHFARKQSPEKVARRILQTQKELYSGPHEFERVDDQALDALDRKFYESAQAFFERQGFRHVGDFRDISIARQHPRSQGLARCLVGDAGTVLGMIGHCRFRGFWGAIQLALQLMLIGLLPKKLKLISLETELNDGTFVVTSNALNLVRTGDVPGVVCRRFPRNTDWEELLESHRESVRSVLSGNPSVVPVQLHGYSDVIKSLHRLHGLKNAHMQSIGYMDAEELARIAGRKLGRSHHAVLEEIEKIKEADSPPSSPPASNLHKRDDAAS